MYLTKEKKEEIFAEFGASAKDTGSAEGQIALFSYRIDHLTGHLKQNKKDHNTERSLIRLVWGSPISNRLGLLLMPFIRPCWTAITNIQPLLECLLFVRKLPTHGPLIKLG